VTGEEAMWNVEKPRAPFKLRVDRYSTGGEVVLNEDWQVPIPFLKPEAFNACRRESIDQSW
jgi:hypothetical protein